MLGWRVLVSVILIAALGALFVLDARLGASAPVLFVLCLLLGIRGSWEAAGLLRRPSILPTFAAAAVAVSMLLLLAWWPRFTAEGSVLEWLVGGFGLCVMGLFVHAAVRFRDAGPTAGALAADVLILSYIGVLLVLTAQLRWVGADRAPYFALASMIVAAKSGDIGAYTLGRLFGRRKMAPRLSPGKTWMGGVGALLGGALGAVLWFEFGPGLFDGTWTPAGPLWAAAYGAILGVVGLVGDLCESLLKRDAGVKDSAALLPGFGGLLDLLDSILFAGPVAWLLWQVLPLGLS